MLHDVMICTVGISLTRVTGQEFQLGSREMIDWMLKKSPEDRQLGAEINSVASILKLNELEFQRNKLILLTSGTEMGNKVGNTLKEYFERHPNLKFNEVIISRVEDLDDQRPIDFKRKGLRNLVREIGKQIKKYGNRLIINATGGFKAQIAFALALGQAVGIPVFYMFERFPQIIELPPLPLSLDSRILLENYDIFKDLKMHSEIEEGDFEKNFNKSYARLDERLKVLLDREKIDGKKYIALNPMGEVFMEATEISFLDLYKHIKLPRSNVLPEKKLHYKEPDHSVQFIKKNRSILDKICELDFVEAIYIKSFSQKYDRKGIFFKLVGDKIEGKFSDKGGSIRFEVMTTATNEKERDCALYLLNKTFERI